MDDHYVLPAYAVGQQLAVWCRHCGALHWHGAVKGPRAGYGHRAAHCTQMTSPYRTGGYELVPSGLTPWKQALILSLARRRRLRACVDDVVRALERMPDDARALNSLAVIVAEVQNPDGPGRFSRAV